MEEQTPLLQSFRSSEERKENKGSRNDSVAMWNGKSIYTLTLLALIFTFGELGHFLIGPVSRALSRDLHFGDKSCLPKSDAFVDTCKKANSSAICEEVEDGECEWDYSGLGWEYQILAGPSFVLVFTVAGILWGIAGDRWAHQRTNLLAVGTILFSIAIGLTSLVQEYYHVVLLRMLLAAGESSVGPLGTSIIYDLFPLEKRGLAMGIFNWGIYLGFGLSYTVGTYIPPVDLFGQGWRFVFVISGIPGIIVGILFFLNGEEKKIESEIPSNDHLNLKVKSEETEKEVDVWTAFRALLRFDVLSLGLAASIRHTAGYCWGYNSALYFQTYYPDFKAAGWLLTLISIFCGAIGSVSGGYVSDVVVAKMGLGSRGIVLSGSQLLAAPFIYGVLYLNPPTAFISLAIGYILTECWFGIMYAILVELVPQKVRGTSLAIGLFVLNNIGGNLPVLVDKLSSLLDNYRVALVILYPSAILTSGILFAIYSTIFRRKTMQ